jgi:hypothetical protein
MLNKAKVACDAFTISLGGMTTVASFFPAPAIAHDRINKILDEQQAMARENRDRDPQPWIGEGRPVAQADCA